MKRILKVSLTALIMIFAAPIGCVKSDTGNALGGLPDLANFTIEAASAWAAGASSLISIMSSTLGAGPFTVHFNLTGANSMNDLTAPLTMSGTTGTFPTPVLSNAGVTNVIITAISNSGGSSSLTSGNSYTFSDSIGLMTATINGASFRATHVTATLPGGAGAMLSIHGVKWTPLTTITLFIDNFMDIPTTMNFTTVSDFAGGTQYSAPAPVNGQFGVHGYVTVVNITPLLTGTFTFTNEDSSIVTGSFSCPHP